MNMRKVIGVLGLLVLVSQWGNVAHAAIEPQEQVRAEEAQPAALQMEPEERAPASEEVKSVQLLPQIEMTTNVVSVSKCSIEESQNNSGKTIYHVVNHGEIEATASNLQEAQSLAGTDARCRR